MRAIYGNQQARARLERAALGDAVSHAWLLTGPSDIGKTTLALEFARLLQCTGRAPTDGDPCGECASCRKIAHGSIPMSPWSSRRRTSARLRSRSFVT